MKFRKVLSSDVHGICCLFESVFNQPISDRFYKWRFLSGGDYTAICCTIGGEIIGHIGYEVRQLVLGSECVIKCAVRSSTFVSNDWAGKGIYHAMLDILKQILLKDHGIKYLIGFPNYNNQIASYKRLDFFPIKFIPIMSCNLRSACSHNDSLTKSQSNMHEVDPKLLEDCYLIDVDFSLPHLRCDSEYYKNRFVCSPSRFYRQITVTKKTGSLAAVFSVDSMKKVSILSLYSDSTDLFYEMFSDLMSRFFKDGFEYISIVSDFNSYKYYTLLRCGFRPTERIYLPSLYFSSVDDDVELLTNRFIFSLCDLDTF